MATVLYKYFYINLLFMKIMLQVVKAVKYIWLHNWLTFNNPMLKFNIWKSFLSFCLDVISIPLSKWSNFLKRGAHQIDFLNACKMTISNKGLKKQTQKYFILSNSLFLMWKMHTGWFNVDAYNFNLLVNIRMHIFL